MLTLRIASFTLLTGSLGEFKSDFKPEEVYMKVSAFFVMIAILTTMACAGGKSEEPAGDAMMKQEVPDPADSMMKKDAISMDSSAYNVSELGPQVSVYTGKADLMNRSAMGGTTVLFFAATWCPTCQATYKDLKMNYSKIPGNVNLVFVNYDKETELKAEFGITTQHSFVELDSKVMKKNLWVGTTSVADILKKIGL